MLDVVMTLVLAGDEADDEDWLLSGGTILAVGPLRLILMGCTGGERSSGTGRLSESFRFSPLSSARLEREKTTKTYLVLNADGS